MHCNCEDLTFFFTNVLVYFSHGINAIFANLKQKQKQKHFFSAARIFRAI